MSNITLNKTTKIIVNQHHALIFSEKMGEIIIGVLVKGFFFFFFLVCVCVITWLRLT